MTTTTQDAFHSMRGHVADGTIVKMNNGDTLTLRHTMRGWQLFDQHGRAHALPTTSAHVVECIIFAYPSEAI